MPKFFRTDPPRSEYAPVAYRIALFYERYTSGRILTNLHSRTDGEIVFRARVYRGPGDRGPAATGWASERQGDGDINITACLENTETSAVGRALANLGFTASSARPSREEMEKARRARARLTSPPVYHRVSSDSVSAGQDDHSRPREDITSLQADADAVTDLLLLLRAARRAGLRDRRAQSIEARVRSGYAPPAMLDRLGRRLRRWIATSVERRLSRSLDSDI